MIGKLPNADHYGINVLIAISSRPRTNTMRMIFGVMKVSNDRKSDMAGSHLVGAAAKVGTADTIRKATAQSGLTPRRPARSWMNCQATRPDREPRVIDHSIASACSAATSIGSFMLAA